MGPETELTEGREAEVLRARVRHLEGQVSLLGSRLLELEQAGAARAADSARLRRIDERTAVDRTLVVTKLTGPLKAFELVLRWIGTKAGKVAGLLARQVAFRRRG